MKKQSGDYIDVPNDDYKYSKKKGKKQTIQDMTKSEQVLHILIKYINFICLFFIAISTWYYVDSLRGCFGTQSECLKELNEGEVRELLWLIQKAAFILAIIGTAAAYKYISIYIVFIILAIFSFLCFYWDTGMALDYHGGYNRFIFAGAFILFFSGINILIFIVRIYIKKPIITIVFVVTGSLIISIIYFYQVQTSCRDWSKGFTNTEISQDNMPCKISQPETCWIDVLGPVFDFSGWLGEDCSIIRNGDRAHYDKHLKEKNHNYISSNLIGFPRTEEYSYEESLLQVIPYKIMKDLVDMEDPDVPEEIKKRVEVMVDFREEKSKILIKIARDEELVKQRKILVKESEVKGDKPMMKNLMIIYIDSISRRHFHRRLPKTAKWIEKFYKTDHPKYTSYQFLKYHSLGYFTQINVMPAFLGKWWLESGGNDFSKYYKGKGAVLGQSISFCGRQLFDIENDQYKGMNTEKYDHEHVALFCDPNYHQADNPYTPFLGPYSFRRRCIHGKETSDYQLEYAAKFWEAYKDVPRVLRLDFIDAHEGSGNVVKYMDGKLEKYLNDLENSGGLDDTFLLFMADHGNNMPGFISLMNSPDVGIEKYLPMMYMVIPKAISEKYGKALSYNEQSIVTPWDIHNTLLQATDAPKEAYNSFGKSIFTKILNERFSCPKFGIRDEFCMCKRNN